MERSNFYSWVLIFLKNAKTLQSNIKSYFFYFLMFFIFIGKTFGQEIDKRYVYLNYINSKKLLVESLKKSEKSNIESQNFEKQKSLFNDFYKKHKTGLETLSNNLNKLSNNQINTNELESLMENLKEISKTLNNFKNNLTKTNYKEYDLEKINNVLEQINSLNSSLNKNIISKQNINNELIKELDRNLKNLSNNLDNLYSNFNNLSYQNQIINNAIEIFDIKDDNIFMKNIKVSPFKKEVYSTTHSISSIPTNFESSIVQGLADFLADRFQKEIYAMGLKKILEEIKEELKNPPLNDIFKNTYNFSENLSDYPSLYVSDIQLLKLYILKDLEYLPDHLFNNQNEKLTIKLTKHIIELSKQKVPLDEITNYIYYETDINNFKEKFDLANRIAYAMKGKDQWVDPSLFEPSNINNDPEKLLFYAFLYESLKNNDLVYNKLKKNISNQDSIIIKQNADTLYKFIETVTYLNKVYYFLQSNEFKIKNFQDLRIYVKGILEFYNKIIRITSPSDSINFKDVDKYLNLLEIIENKEYNKIISYFLLNFSKELNLANNQNITKVLMFLSDLSSVKNEDDVKNLLEAYALPIGSASIKRGSKCNVSINGYVGFTFGHETINNSAKPLYFKKVNNLGLTAPIGISFTPFFCRYLTLFASAFDLGSLVNARLSNDSIVNANLKFEHFLAPGLSITFNCPKSPISFAVSNYYIPNLKKFTLQNGNEISVTRLNASILVDIPFFTLHNKPRSPKK